MKIVLLHDGDDKKSASDLLEVIKEQRINGESLPFEGDWETKGPSWEEKFAEATHFIAIFSESSDQRPSGPSWFSFAAGFARGSGRPLVLFGANMDALGAHFIKDGIRIRDGGEFSAYLIRESEEWTRANRVKQARDSLLEQGIPVTLDSLGRCIKEKDCQAVSLFLQAGFAADTLDKAGVPLLCLAVRAGDRGIVSLLLQAGAQVNLKSQDRGGSALIDAALGKHSEILGDLLAAGADTDTKSKDGQSPLIISVGLNDEPTVEMLLKAGANADEPDSLGASARKYATLFNKPGMVALFQKYAPAK
ncbi:ankyrin repeat protein [Treponema primitia ZAS-2]|uniref:Ankyrin repeat protein n=1 Tax=Treponema primitia (strain ATCC BAA-887 / DSM 12427 / ZAS-2) TaxID=545694 RepID=F5YPX0_TREPZ|nr:ankyrin repeat domain-containing protein [Treponema primitia]AEF84706.1 ankyrin repeat protein [Treponema primitia ZAS-2]